MNEHSRRNLGEIIRRVEDPERAKAGLKADRDRIARLLREARVRVKAKARKEYEDYCLGRTDPRD